MAAAIQPDRFATERLVRAAWAPQPGPQTAAILCPIQNIGFGGARGGGKTSWEIGDNLIHSARWAPHGRGILFRRTYDELDEVRDQCAEVFNRIKGARWRASQNTWFFPFGGFLKLRYLAADKDADRYQGHQYNWLGVDEAGNFGTSIAIKKVRATLRDKHGVPCLFRMTANPGGPGHAWIKSEWIDVAQPMTPYRNPDTGEWQVFIPSRLQDNRILIDNDPGYLNRLRGAGPAWLVRAWLDGDWNATPEGGIIKGEWLEHRYTMIPAAADVCVHSWDTANKAAEINDPTVCTVWQFGRGTRGYYLRDEYRKRVEYPALRQAVIDLAERDRPNAVLIEDKASGQQLIQDLRNSTSLPIIAIEPLADKTTRMYAATPAMEAGLVFLPAAARWVLDYVIELTTFPLSPHKDRVDSTSQFLNWVRNFSGTIIYASTGTQHAGFAADGATETIGVQRATDYTGY